MSYLLTLGSPERPVEDLWAWGTHSWGTHGWGITWKFFSPHKMTLLRETTQLILQGSAFACKLHFDRIYWIGERWTLLTVMVTPWRNDCPYHPTVRIKCVETDTGLSAKRNLPEPDKMDDRVSVLPHARPRWFSTRRERDIEREKERKRGRKCTFSFVLHPFWLAWKN